MMEIGEDTRWRGKYIKAVNKVTDLEWGLL